MKKAETKLLTQCGPDSLAGRFLRHFWHPVLLAQDVKAGQTRRVKILGEFFTVYRGTSGTPYVVQDRCPHRGTQLSVGWIECDTIRCRYHGWTFDGAGTCVELPAEKEAFRRKVRIDAFPTREYLGLIFAFFGQGKPPELPRYPELEDESRGTLLARATPFEFNFFQRLENDYDEVHLHFTHRSGIQGKGLSGVPEISAEETSYGFVAWAGRARSPQKGNYCIMPNAVLTMVPRAFANDDFTIHLGIRVPVDDENTMSFTVNRIEHVNAAALAAAESADTPQSLARRILATEMSLEDVPPDHPELFIIQDSVALGGQGKIVDRTGERLGQSDAAVILLRKIWLRELRALESGRPLKPWQRPRQSFVLKTGIHEGAA